MKWNILISTVFVSALWAVAEPVKCVRPGTENGMVPLVVMSNPEDAKGAWVNDFRKRGRCSLRCDAERGCLVLSFTNLYCHLVIPEFTRRLKECAAALDPKTFYVKYRAPEYEATTELKFESHGVYHVPILPVAPGPDLSLAVARANLAWSSNGSAFSATNVTVSFIAPSGSGILEIYEMGILKEVRRPPAAPRDPTPVAADAFAVYPEPREWKLSEGAFLLPKRCPWRAADLPAVAREEFRKDMADFHGVELVDAKGDGAAIVFALSNDLGPVVHDGFTIRADAGGIAVRAREPAGLAFAANTLADLIWRAGGERIPAFELRDWPRKRLRPWQDATMGCGHDQKYAVPFYTEMLRRFPLGARYNRIGHYMDTTFQWRAPAMPRQGNAWTAADYSEIVDYVNGHGVRMMPTIQSLGHMDFFIALPKGNAARFCEDGKPGVLCTRNPESTALLMDMYDELISLCSRNPGMEPDYFYTMHDEVRWLTHAVPEQNRCRRCAGVPKNRLFLESVLRCRAEIARRGMTMVMATDMITDSHNGRNRFNCAAIKDEIPKDVVLSSWSALDDIEIDSFARKGYRNWKLYTGLHANPEGDENVEAIGFGIFSFNWWLSRVRSVDPVSYGILASYLQAYFAWREAPTGEKDERLVLARKYGDFLMRSWSRKPLPRKAGERPLAIDPPPRPGKVASLVFTHGAELAPADRAAFLSRTNTHDALKGPVIAIWRARYSDGKVAEIPIQYGWNVGDVESDGHRLTEVLRRYLADCRRVIPDETDTHVRFEYEWANPRPDTEIVALELEEKSALCRYRLFALSAGMLKPARASGIEPFAAPGRFVHDAERPVAATGMKLVSRPSPWYGRMPGSLKVWATEDADGTCGKRLLAETGVLPPCYAGESQFLTWSATTSRYWLVEVDKSGTDAIVRHGQYMNWAGFSERGVWGFPHNKDGKASPNLIDIARVELFTELPADAPCPNPAGLACPEHRLVKDWLMRDFGVEEGARRYSTVGYDAGYVARCRVRRAERLKRLRAFTDRIVYVKHYTMGGDAELHGTALVTDEPVTGRPTNFRAGGALCLLTILPDGSVTNEVLVSCPNGCIRDPDVSHDGRTLVFSMRESFNENAYIKARRKGEPTRERAFPYDFYTKLEGDDYHLYTLDLETRSLRQITFSVPAPCADIEPCWTSDGRIVFQSSRCEQVIPCHQTMDLNLYSCDADGGNVRRLAIDGGSTSHPVELPDGRILYTRYEYNDRCARLQQPLFSMRADGTDQTAFYGNASAYPASLLHFRPIPESSALLGIVSGHHVHQVGKLARLDPRLGTEGDDGLTFVAGSDLEGKGAVVRSAYAKNPKMARGRCPHGYDFAFQAGPLWQNPYPISEKEFLVGFLPEGSLTIKYHLNPGFGIYWQDETGDRELLAYDPAIECSQPIPVHPRPKAHAFAAKPLDWETAFGIFHVQNVYFGPGLEGVKPGTVKKLRVVAVENRPTYTYSAPMGQKGESRFDGLIAYDGDWSGEAITLGGSWDVKHVLGEVDVNPDGSCLFRCPALNAVYFQLLDERGRCVQTMRSWTHLQPGETASCLGCHESKRTAYPAAGKSYAGNVQEIRPAPGQPPHPLLARLKPAGRWSLLASTANYMGVNAPRATDPDAPAEGFSYRALVQPILDRNCVKCHDGKGDAAKRPNLTGAWRRDVNPRAHRKFSESYVALTRNGYQTQFCNWYSSGGRSAMLPPCAQGSCASRLMDFLDGKHQGVKVTDDEYRVVACWLDLAIPFGGSYCEATDWTDDDRKVYDYHQRKREAFVRTEMESVRAKIGADAPGARWVNIGSNSGLFAFDWESAHVNGLNLARSPQSERGGAKMVKARRNAIAAGAYVIIPICPFSSILPESYDRRRGAESHPLISFDGMPDERAMSAFADKLDKGWKREFSIRDYSDPMTATNRQCYFACVAHMRDFIGWCRQEGLKPVLVLPPAAKCLRDLFPDSFMKDYVYGFVRDAIRGTDVQFLDYWNHRDFQDPRLFATALFLNKMGRRRFTARVMADCLNGKGDTREMRK